MWNLILSEGEIDDDCHGNWNKGYMKELAS
jgi:hypothetical protein